jgi:hypothetical protein
VLIKKIQHFINVISVVYLLVAARIFRHLLYLNSRPLILPESARRIEVNYFEGSLYEIHFSSTHFFTVVSAGIC